MNRKQKKQQVNNLIDEVCKTKMEIKHLQEEHEKEIQSYMDAITWLKKRLDNGESYVVERVAVDVDMTQMLYDMMNSNLPKEMIEEYINEKCMNMMFKELIQHPDLIQNKDINNHRLFYMEVLKLDKNPHIPQCVTIPNIYKHVSINPYSEC